MFGYHHPTQIHEDSPLPAKQVGYLKKSIYLGIYPDPGNWTLFVPGQKTLERLRGIAGGAEKL